MDPHVLSLAIRWAHVAAMAAALGGAVLVLFLTMRTELAARELHAAAEGYERIFWAAAGVLVGTHCDGSGSTSPARSTGMRSWAAPSAGVP